MGRATNPDNRWLWAVESSPEELVQARARGVDALVKIGAPPSVQFTCDTCAQAPVCTLAFDPYNTNGDCLYEK